MSAPSVSFAPPPAVLSKPFEAGQEPMFAFARLQADVCLVQLIGQTTVDPSGTTTPLLNIHVFRHEFVSMFRYSHSASVHPLQLRVIEPLDDHAVRYEPDNGTVFLAKDLMAHLKRILESTAMLHRVAHRSPVPQRQWY